MCTNNILIMYILYDIIYSCDTSAWGIMSRLPTKQKQLKIDLDKQRQLDGDLEKAIQSGNVAAAKSVISLGADINGTNIQGDIYLYMAYKLADADMVNMLIRCGADVGFSHDRDHEMIQAALDFVGLTWQEARALSSRAIEMRISRESSGRH